MCTPSTLLHLFTLILPMREDRRTPQHGSAGRKDHPTPDWMVELGIGVGAGPSRSRRRVPRRRKAPRGQSRANKPSPPALTEFGPASTAGRTPGLGCSGSQALRGLRALSARSSTGRRRRGPRRDRTAGMPRMSGLWARLSCMFAPDTATASGMPWASDSTCSLLPFLPRSTGVGPGQRSRILARTEAASRITEVQSTSPRAPSSSGTARYSRRHRPTSVHIVQRRCAVAGRRAERRRQMPPGTAAGQRVPNCGEHGPLVTRSGPTILRTSSERRQQRGGRLPEFVRNQTLR